MFCVGTSVSLAAFLAGQAVLAGQHRAVDLGDPGLARAVLGAGGYLTVTALLGVALGVLLRHTAAAVVGVLALGFGSSVLGGLGPVLAA